MQGNLWLNIVIPIRYALTAAAEPRSRRTISLDGRWRIAEGLHDAVPAKFDHKVPVPGLGDTAQPSFEEVGVNSTKREAFWYRRTFHIDVPIPAGAAAAMRSRSCLSARLARFQQMCATPGWRSSRVVATSSTTCTTSRAKSRRRTSWPFLTPPTNVDSTVDRLIQKGIMSDDRTKAMRWQHPEFIPISMNIAPSTWIKYREDLDAIVRRHPVLFGTS
jgi:hypothetical protein